MSLQSASVWAQPPDPFDLPGTDPLGDGLMEDDLLIDDLAPLVDPQPPGRAAMPADGGVSTDEQAGPVGQEGAAEEDGEASAPDAAEPEDLALPERLRGIVMPDGQPPTPADAARSVLLLLNYGQVQPARQLMDQLVQQVPAGSAQQQLGTELGVVSVVRLATEQRLSPAHRAWANDVLAEVKRSLEDPQRLADLTDQLAGATDRGQARAILRQLLPAGAHGLAAIIERLAAEQDPDRQQMLLRGAATFDPWMPPLVTAILASGDASDLAARLLAVLPPSRHAAMRPYLLGPAAGSMGNPAVADVARRILGQQGEYAGLNEFSPQAARERLHELAQRTLDMSSSEGSQTVWTWDPQARRLDHRDVSADEARLVRAMRLAADAYRLAPADRRALELRLLTSLAVDQQLGGLQNPLREGPGTPHAEALAAGPEVLASVLDSALQMKLSPAAIAVCQVVGDLGDPVSLRGTPHEPSALVRALRSHDRRVQFAAAQAIHRLAGTSSYPGKSMWEDTVHFLASGSGQRRVLICHPNTAVATRWSGWVLAIGRDVEICSDLRQARAILGKSADFEFIILADQWHALRVEQAIEQVRQDPRAATLPVAVWTADPEALRWQVLERRDPTTRVMAVPTGMESTARVVDRLEQLEAALVPPAAERLRQADAARAWLGIGLGEPSEVPARQAVAPDGKRIRWTGFDG